MKILGVIPARYNSSRFPGKPLVEIQQKSMIQRVYEQATKASCLSTIIVATDDERIYNHVKHFGGEVVMTSSDHKSGTERCVEAYHKVASELNSFDVVINIQGDEPFINPQQIEKVAECFTKKETQIATLAKIINDEQELNNPNVVKLVVDKHLRALYFSRFPIPYIRDAKMFESLKNNIFLKHIGIYAYRSHILENICKLPSSPLEISESLEQLRWLENGYQIYVNFSDAESLAIDTPEDVAKAEIFYNHLNAHS